MDTINPKSIDQSPGARRPPKKSSKVDPAVDTMANPANKTLAEGSIDRILANARKQLSGAKEHEAEGSGDNRPRYPKAKSQKPGSSTDTTILNERNCQVLVEKINIEESASDASVSDRTRSRSRLGKRTRDERTDEGSDDSTETALAVKKPALKTFGKTSRGRGRLQTTGARAAKIAAKEMLKADKKRQKIQDAETEAETLAQKVRKALSITQYSAREQTADELIKAIRTGTDTIIHCAKKSGNVHGVFQRNFSDATALILKAVETLAERSSNEETRRLTAENAKLKEELSELRKEFAELKAQQRREGPVPSASVPASAPILTPGPSQAPDREQLERDIMAKCGAMINAQIQRIGDRLLPEKRRIPLAADRKNLETLSDPGTPSLQESTSGPSTPSSVAAPAKSGAKAPKSAKEESDAKGITLRRCSTTCGVKINNNADNYGPGDKANDLWAYHWPSK